MSAATLILILAVVGGLYMAWNIGANDVANAMGTSVGSGALTLARAVVLAGIFEFGGAVLAGSDVTDTIRKGIIETSVFGPAGPFGTHGPLLLAVAMLCALLAAAVWLHVATHLALPVSTTHSIVGAVVGVGLVSVGWSGVDWGTIVQIVLSWVVSPVLGGAIAYATFIYIRNRILRSDDPVEATKAVGPVLVAIVVGIIVVSIIYKALNNVIQAPPLLFAIGVATVIAVLVGEGARRIIRRTAPRTGSPFVYVERIFAYLQVSTACYVAFAHGANDVANAVGPLSAIVTLDHEGFASVSGKVPVPTWVLLLGGAGIVFGLATLGHKVIATIGREITEITPTRGFSAEFGAATTVLVASRMGLPISTTHTLVGGVIGVGFAQGIGALNFRVIRNIVNSWIATIPAAAGLAALFFVVARTFVLP